MYRANLSILWRFFAASDFIYLAILLKLGLLVLFLLKLADKSRIIDIPKASFSFFLTLLFTVYCLAIAKIPNFLYARYFIPMQPVLTLIVILDAAVIYNYISQQPSAAAVYWKGVLVFMFIGFVFYNISINAEKIRGHAYEVMHQNKGPLDYVIPYIKGRYAAPDKLVIATNYEETSFMYYLNAKVTYGYVGNNIAQDQLFVPDIIISRKKWKGYFQQFYLYLKAFPYVRVRFPVIDSAVNNIPELAWVITHRFRTEETSDESQQLDIYLRK